MDLGSNRQMGAVGCIEVVQIVDMLEVVGIQLAFFQRGIGNDVVIKFHDFQSPAFSGQIVLQDFQNFSMGSGSCADFDGLVVSLAATGSQGQGQHQNQCQSDDLLHFLFSFSYL